MRYSASEKYESIQLVEQSNLSVNCWRDGFMSSESLDYEGLICQAAKSRSRTGCPLAPQFP